MDVQSLIGLIYPPQCAICNARTTRDFALCGRCWGQIPFIDGVVCDGCGTPLPGEWVDEAVHCDDCRTLSRPWSKGRAAAVYDEQMRRLVLALKYGDRPDLARSAAPWLARAGQEFFGPESVLVPVPLHRFRLLRRTYNQAVELARALSKHAQVQMLPDAVLRVKATAPLDHHSPEERVATLRGAFALNPKRAEELVGRQVILVDDVMTSGATFAAVADACKSAGAREVCVLALARAVKTL